MVKQHEHRPLRIKFCPECKATDVRFVFKVKNLFGLVPRIECLKCGNSAPDFPIVIMPVEKKKSVKKVKNNNLSKKKIGGKRK